MRNIVSLMLLFCTVFLVCCSKDTPTAPATPPPNMGAGTVTSKNGNFINGPYGTVSGTATLTRTDGKYQIVLDNFSSSNGPDLKVYLSKEINPVNFINLGSLRAVTGKQAYDVPTAANAEDYTYALIYCKQFSHLFGSAELKK